MNENLIDTHVHGFPNRLFHAIWEYFEKNYWHIHQKLEFEEIVQFLPQFGIKTFTILNYAHKPEMSRSLNNWTYSMGKKYSQTIPFGTIHPRDTYFREEVIRILSPNQLNLYGIKFQLMVTDFTPDHSTLDYLYEHLTKFNKILIIHAGTGPVTDMLLNKSLKTSPYVGIEKLIPVLERFPNLKMQIPHLGCMETNKFFDLVADYPQIHFDTSMALEFIFGEQRNRFPIDMDLSLERIEELQDNIMFGSDFPNIPHSYSVAINTIENLPLNRKIKDKILFKNAQKFYNLEFKEKKDNILN